MFDIFVAAFLGAVSGVAFACWGVMKIIKHILKEQQENVKDILVFTHNQYVG